MKQSITHTIGMDLGDTYNHIVVLVGNEEDPSETTKIRTTQEGICSYFGSRSPATVAIEVGTHSPWISRLLAELGHTVIIANPREVRLISNSRNKTDWGDAEKLARLARSDPKLLHPIQHRGPEAQEAASLIRARDAAVRARTLFVNHIRAVVKGVGQRLPRCSAESFHKHMENLPKERRRALQPLRKCLRILTDTVHQFDRAIKKTVRDFSHEVSTLSQVDGIGPLTALAYVTCLEDPHRFTNSRCVGSYLGLCSRNHQSSNRDPDLPISKAGNPYVRRLLVSAAQRILGPFGKDSDLRRWGLKLASRGKNAKKRAAVGVARKLAVLLHRLWITGEPYEPLKHASKEDPGKEAEAIHRDFFGATQDKMACAA